MNYFISEISEQQIKLEKEKARQLRKSRWWHTRISSGVCHYCGRSFLVDELTMDHIVPIIRGGKSTKNNVVPACKVCNSNKKYLLPIEWEDYLKEFNHEGVNESI